MADRPKYLIYKQITGVIRFSRSRHLTSVRFSR